MKITITPAPPKAPNPTLRDLMLGDVFRIRKDGETNHYRVIRFSFGAERETTEISISTWDTMYCLETGLYYSTTGLPNGSYMETPIVRIINCEFTGTEEA